MQEQLQPDMNNSSCGVMIFLWCVRKARIFLQVEEEYSRNFLVLTKSIWWYWWTWNKHVRTCLYKSELLERSMVPVVRMLLGIGMVNIWCRLPFCITLEEIWTFLILATIIVKQTSNDYIFVITDKNSSMKCSTASTLQNAFLFVKTHSFSFQPFPHYQTKEHSFPVLL